MIFFQLVPLHAACKEGHAEVVALLLKKKADVKVKTPNGLGHNCLNIAVSFGQTYVFALNRFNSNNLTTCHFITMCMRVGYNFSWINVCVYSEATFFDRLEQRIFKYILTILGSGLSVKISVPIPRSNE